MSATDSSQLFGVKGMVVVITGGGTGIGYIMTKAFVDNGAEKVYIIGRRKEKLDEAAQYNSQRIVPLAGDVTSKDSLHQISEQIKKETGYINMLICNSGTMTKPIGALASEMSVAEYAKIALQQEPEDWSATFAVNISSVFFTTMAFLVLLDAGNQKRSITGRTSQVLITSSIAGFMRQPSSVGAYGTSKAAATHLTKHLASAIAPYGIRVNAIAPGLFQSDLADGLIKRNVKEGHEPTEEGAVTYDNIPARRIGRESDMAGTVLYLASNAASFLNGNITVIDGGRLSQAPSTY